MPINLNLWNIRKAIQDKLGKTGTDAVEFLALTDVVGFEVHCNAMVATALATANNAGRDFHQDVIDLLKFYVCSKMRCRELAVPQPMSLFASIFKRKSEKIKEAELIAGIYRVYSNTHGPVDTPLELTLSRLTLAFPFETAIVRARHPEECLLPGSSGDLNPILAFPAALLLIPTSWTRTIKQWEEWFLTFVSYYVGFPMSPEHEERVNAFTEVLKNNARDCDYAMKLLGISESSPS